MLLKKHYEAIAEITAKQVNGLERDGTDESELGYFILFQLAADTADYFEQDNPKFDRQRFMKACGLE